MTRARAAAEEFMGKPPTDPADWPLWKDELERLTKFVADAVSQAVKERDQEFKHVFTSAQDMWSSMHRQQAEEIARLRAKIADWEDAGREWSVERERLRVAAARETLRANAYLNRIKELKALTPPPVAPSTRLPYDMD